jgi:hypothetical protein
MSCESSSADTDEYQLGAQCHHYCAARDQPRRADLVCIFDPGNGGRGSQKADHAHERISAPAEAESKFREKIFLEYVNRDILREMEARLERAIEHLARTSAEAIDRLGDRLDGMSDVRRRPG